MIINQDKTKSTFKQSADIQYFQYLKNRNVCSQAYVKALRNGIYGFPVDNSIEIDGDEYSINYFLGPSDEGIYDLIRDNQIYGIKPEEGTIFAVLLGDDFLFFKPSDEAVYFCFRDTDEITEIAPDFDTFIKNTFTGENENEEN